MASNDKVLVRVAERDDVWQALCSDYSVTRDGDWAEIEDEVGQDDAKKLSARFDVPTVYWCIHTVVDLIWLVAFRGGKQVRELQYSEGRWLPASGRACEFENRSAISRLRKRNDLCASPDGYDVLAAFLGKEVEEQPEPIADADATQRFYLAAPVAAEAQRVAASLGASIGTVLQATWEVAKGELHSLSNYDDEALVAPPARELASICSVQPRDVPPLPDAKAKVEASVSMRRDVLEEIQALSAHLDRPMSWVVNEAYRRGRSHLAAL